MIPFGAIEFADRTIMWRDENEMNVLGLREAWAQAVAILLPGGVPAKVPTIPAQAILKVMAWRDRHVADARDAIDLATIVDWYSTGSFLELLYDQHFDLVENNGHSPELAGAHRLGQDMAQTLDRQSFETFSRTLDDESLMSRLANDMGQSAPTSAARIAALRAGFLAAAPR